MNAAQFYDAFLAGWSMAPNPVSLKRMSGPTLKWKASTAAGAVHFAFATNSKTAGLLPNLPGEFRLSVHWNHGVGPERRKDPVSWFQYTTDSDAQAYAALQRRALAKFLAQPGKAALREIYPYANDPTCLPRANFDEFACYFDAEDARGWGLWYAGLVESWLDRFSASPETFNDWCWRVLWPDR